MQITNEILPAKLILNKQLILTVNMIMQHNYVALITQHY